MHDAGKGGFRAASASVRHTGDGWELAAAVESVWSRDNAFDGINAKLGARFDLGQADIGLAWLHPKVNDRPDALALDLVFPLTTRLAMMAFGAFTDGGREDAGGLAIDYRVRPDTSLLVALTDGAQGGGVHLTLERRF